MCVLRVVHIFVTMKHKVILSVPFIYLCPDISIHNLQRVVHIRKKGSKKLLVL